MIAVMDRDQITAEVAARLVAGQFPQWTRHSDDGGQEAARRFGWRYSPRQVISRVIADDARTLPGTGCSGGAEPLDLPRAASRRSQRLV